MSRPPSHLSSQQTLSSQNKPSSSKSPYSNFSQQQSKSNQRDVRYNDISNNLQLNNILQHIESMPNTNNGLTKKPSLLSGYHNPSFSATDRNDIMPLNPLGLPGGMPRFYVPPSASFNSNYNPVLLNGIQENSYSLEDQKLSSNKSRILPNQMNLINNQQQSNRSNSSMNSPNHQHIGSSHQQIINSGFSPAVIAAASSALNSNNPQLSQLIQHQLQLQHQQLSQLHPFQNQFQQPQTEASFTKKEPRENSSSNPSPQIISTQQNIQPSVEQTQSSSNQGTHSSCYVPQVEAISPTPEDQKENSNLEAIKEKIIAEICKVEKDIASTQYQFDMLEKKQKEIKELQSRPLVDENGDNCIKLTSTLAEKIYQENRKTLEISHRQVLSSNILIGNGVDENSFDEDMPLYHEFSDTKLSQDIRKNFDTVLKQRLIKFFKRQIFQKKKKEQSLIEEYDSLHSSWQKKVDKTENNCHKKQKDAKCREFYEKVFPELRKAREEKERLLQKQKAAAAELQVQRQKVYATPEGETQDTSSTDPIAQISLLSIENTPTEEVNSIEEERKRIYQLAVVPPLCLNQRQKRYSFINNNGFVKDPIALFKSTKNEVFWNDKEKEIFLDKLLMFGKNFEIIATFLEKKKTQDCIEYYYLTKKKINYKLLIRKHQRKRKQKPNLAAILANNNNNNNNGGSGNSSSSTFNSNNNALNSSSNNSLGGSATTSNQTSNCSSSSQSGTRQSALVESSAKNSTGTFDNINNKPKFELSENRISYEENSTSEKKLVNQQSEQSDEFMKTTEENEKKHLTYDYQTKENYNGPNDENTDNYDSNGSNNRKKDSGSTLCFLCRKNKTKKKGKNRTRLRKLPTKLKNLSEASLKILKEEFKLYDEFKIDLESKYRYCNSCFKNFLTRVSELDNLNNAQSLNDKKEKFINENQSLMQTELDDYISDDDYDECATDDSFDSESAESNFEKNSKVEDGENKEKNSTSQDKSSMILKVNEYSEMSKSESPKTQSDSNNNLINEKELTLVQKHSPSSENDSDIIKNKISNTEGGQPISVLINETIKNALSDNSDPKANLIEPTTSLFSNNSKQSKDKNEKINETKDMIKSAPFNILADLINKQLQTSNNPPETQIPTNSSTLDSKTHMTLGCLVDSIIVQNVPTNSMNISCFDHELAGKSYFNETKPPKSPNQANKTTEENSTSNSPKSTSAICNTIDHYNRNGDDSNSTTYGSPSSLDMAANCDSSDGQQSNSINDSSLAIKIGNEILKGSLSPGSKSAKKMRVSDEHKGVGSENLDIELDNSQTESRQRISSVTRNILSNLDEKKTVDPINILRSGQIFENFIQSEFDQEISYYNRNESITKKLLQGKDSKSPIENQIKRQKETSRPISTTVNSQIETSNCGPNLLLQISTQRDKKSPKLEVPSNLDNMSSDSWNKMIRGLIVKSLKEAKSPPNVPSTSPCINLVSPSSSPKTSPVKRSHSNQQLNIDNNNNNDTNNGSHHSQLMGSDLISQARSYGRPGSSSQNISPGNSSMNIKNNTPLTPQMLSNISQQDKYWYHQQQQQQQHENQRYMHEMSQQQSSKHSHQRRNSNSSVIVMSPSPPVRSSPQSLHKQHQASTLNPNNLSNSQFNAIIQAAIQNTGISNSNFNSPVSYTALASSECLPLFNAQNQKEVNNHGLNAIGIEQFMSTLSNSSFPKNGMVSPSSNFSKLNNSPRTENPATHTPQQQMQQHASFLLENQNSHIARNSLEQYNSSPILSKNERYSPSQYNFNLNSHNSNPKNQNFKINSPYLPPNLLQSSSLLEKSVTNQINFQLQQQQFQKSQDLLNSVSSQHHKAYENLHAHQGQLGIKKRSLINMEEPVVHCLTQPIRKPQSVPNQISPQLIQHHILNNQSTSSLSPKNSHHKNSNNY